MTTDDEPHPDEPENGGKVYPMGGRWVCPRCTQGYASRTAADECCWWD